MELCTCTVICRPFTVLDFQYLFISTYLFETPILLFLLLIIITCRSFNFSCFKIYCYCTVYSSSYYYSTALMSGVIHRIKNKFVNYHSLLEVSVNDYHMTLKSIWWIAFTLL